MDQTLAQALDTMASAEKQYNTVTSPGRLLYVGAIGKFFMDRAGYDALTRAGYTTMIPCERNAYSETSWKVTDKLVEYCKQEKSTGHRAFIGDYEYFVVAEQDNSLYRALISNPVLSDGYRNGARWECYASLADWRIEMLTSSYSK